MAQNSKRCLKDVSGIIQSGLCGLWRNQELCDVIITTKDGVIKCHKVVLAAHSSTLARLISDYSPEDVVRIRLPAYSMKTIWEMLNFLYVSDSNLSIETIHQSISLAMKLGLPAVLEACKNLLINCANSDNIILHYCIALNNNLHDVSRVLFNIVSENFCAVSQTTQFLYLSMERLLPFIQCENLNVLGEVDVFRAVVRWINFDRNNRIRSAKKLMSAIHFEDIPDEELVVETEKNHWLLSECTPVRGIVFDVIRCQCARNDPSPNCPQQFHAPICNSFDMESHGNNFSCIHNCCSFPKSPYESENKFNFCCNNTNLYCHSCPRGSITSGCSSSFDSFRSIVQSWPGMKRHLQGREDYHQFQEINGYPTDRFLPEPGFFEQRPKKKTKRKHKGRPIFPEPGNVVKFLPKEKSSSRKSLSPKDRSSTLKATMTKERLSSGKWRWKNPRIAVSSGTGTASGRSSTRRVTEESSASTTSTGTSSKPSKYSDRSRELNIRMGGRKRRRRKRRRRMGKEAMHADSLEYKKVKLEAPKSRTSRGSIHEVVLTSSSSGTTLGSGRKVRSSDSRNSRSLREHAGVSYRIGLDGTGGGLRVGERIHERGHERKRHKRHSHTNFNNAQHSGDSVELDFAQSDLRFDAVEPASSTDSVLSSLLRRSFVGDNGARMGSKEIIRERPTRSMSRCSFHGFEDDFMLNYNLSSECAPYLLLIGGLDLHRIDDNVPGRCVMALSVNPDQGGKGPWIRVFMQLEQFLHHHQAAVVHGKLYLVGGAIFDPEIPNRLGVATDGVTIFNFRTGHWRLGSPMTIPRAYFGMARWHDRLIVVGGEGDDSIETDIIDYYDTSADKWGTLTRHPGGPRLGVAAAVLKNVLYVVGGYTESRNSRGEIMADTFSYNLMTGQWSLLSFLDKPTSHASLVVLNNSTLILAGGRTVVNGQKGSSTDAILAFYETRNVWKRVGRLSVGRHDMASAVVKSDGSGSCAYLIGGMSNPNPAALRIVECLMFDEERERSTVMRVTNCPYAVAGGACCLVK